MKHLSSLALQFELHIDQQLKHLLLYLGKNLAFHWHNNYFISLLTSICKE